MGSKGNIAAFNYYNDTGSGSIVYPQVIDPSGKVVWDGRDQSGFRWELTINESVTFNLVVNAKVKPGAVYSAGFNVVAGSDRHDLSDQFVVDPNGQTTKFTFFGPADNGTIQYDGISSSEDLKKDHDEKKIHDKKSIKHVESAEGK